MCMDILRRLQNFDVQLFGWLFRSFQGPTVSSLAKAVSRSADGFLHLAIPFLLYCLGVENVMQFCVVLALSGLCERIVYVILKNTLQRRRPQDYEPDFHGLITPSDQFSFPSGHSSGAFLLATLLSVTYGGPVFALFLWAGAVAVSRILLGVHYPGDTLAGAIMGSTIALVVISLTGAQ